MATETETSKECSYTCDDVAAYLTSGTYPPGADKALKRSIRKRSAYFTMDAGHLHYIGGKGKHRPRLVVQSEEE